VTDCKNYIDLVCIATRLAIPTNRGFQKYSSLTAVLLKSIINILESDVPLFDGLPGPNRMILFGEDVPTSTARKML